MTTTVIAGFSYANLAGNCKDAMSDHCETPVYQSRIVHLVYSTTDPLSLHKKRNSAKLENTSQVMPA